MRRTPLFFACAGLELARYFVLVYAAGPFAAISSSAPQVLRLVAAPNALFAVAFFFLGLDAERYGAYRPLVMVGKAITLFASFIALPRLFSGGAAAAGASLIAFMGITLWDAVSVAALALKRKAVSPQAPAAQSEPESVEMD